MTERNFNEELLKELEQERPVVEGFEYVSEDPLKNLIYANVETETQPAGSVFKILIGGDVDNAQDLAFHYGNPADGVKGFTLETLIDIALTRTVLLNEKVPDWHNNFVIDGLTLSSNSLDKRNADRAEANVQHSDKETPRKGRDDFHPIVRRLITNHDKFNFIISTMAAMAESYDQIVDQTVQDEFLEMTPEGPKRKINVTPEEDEAITKVIATSQKILAVVEQSPLFNIILGTMVHAKKLQGLNQQSTTPTSESSEQPSDSTQEQTLEK